MTYWIAGVVAISLASFPGVASAQMRGDTSRTGAHRLLSWPESVLSWTIRSRRCQSARAIRCCLVSGNYRNKPSETQTKSATLVGRASIHRAFAPRFDPPRYRPRAFRRD